jgi:DNA-binding MarR family transcriptional regulator
MLARDPRDVDEEDQDLLLALFRMVRCMRTQAPGEVIDLPAMYVLQYVAESPGIRVSELADRVGLDPSTLSRLTRTLERAGYLDRHQDPRDGRAAQMHISDSGDVAMRQARQWRTTMIAQAFTGWSPKERSRFVELGMRFVSDFEKALVH